MDKEQQIEEMARVACEHFDFDMLNQPCKKCKSYDKHCYTIRQAEILYNAGYRKIDENCAVITKAELKEYKRQALKEFAQMLEECAKSCKKSGYDGIDEEDIDLILKEYEE